MTSEWLLHMSIEVLYLPQNLYPQKQISGYAPGKFRNFVYFFLGGGNHVKFRHFVNFSYLYFQAKMYRPPSKFQLLCLQQPACWPARLTQLLAYYIHMRLYTALSLSTTDIIMIMAIRKPHQQQYRN